MLNVCIIQTELSFSARFAKVLEVLIFLLTCIVLITCKVHFWYSSFAFNGTYKTPFNVKQTEG